MTTEGIFDILSKRLCESRAYYAMKREIAADPLVTSVEYVRCRIVFRQAIGRLKLLTPRISPERERKPGESRFVFRTGFDTHGWVCRSFTRAKPGRANAANQIRNGGTTTWQTKR